MIPTNGSSADARLARAFFRIPEVCEQLSLGRTAVYRLIASGQLRSCKFGRSTRISASALFEFIEAKVNEGS